MDRSTSNLKEKVVNRAINSLRKDKRIEQISFAAIARELGVGIEEISSFYTSTEDIILEVQKKSWESLHRYWDRYIKKANTPGDFKNTFELFFERFVDTLTKDADLHLELCCYLPKCIKYREKNRQKVKQKFKNLIKRGWPGKDEKVLERQTDLVLLSAYGFYEYCATVGKRERKVILKDFNNMINLHLQDRLFF